MTHYALVSSPFGNFAVSAMHTDNPPTIESPFRLTPIGNLDALPLTTLHDGIVVLDRDALAAEAHRQLEARGVQAHPHVTPSPEFTVNRAQYTATLETATRHYPDGSHTYVYGERYGQQLTDSARAKLTAWWMEVREQIVTPEFLARSVHDSALNDERWAQRAADEARRAADQADAELAAARDAVTAASAALDGMGL